MNCPITNNTTAATLTAHWNWNYRIRFLVQFLVLGEHLVGLKIAGASLEPDLSFLVELHGSTVPSHFAVLEVQR